MWNVDLRLGYFLPSFLVPISSYPPIFAGFLLLFASIYTFTLNSGLRPECTLIRLALAPPAIFFFGKFGYDTSYDTPSAQVAVGMVVIGLYGIMRVIDTSVVTLIDPTPPVWIQTSTGTALPIPTSTRERLMYTFDLATSLRGTSWFSDRHWNWAPTPLIRAPTMTMPRRSFLARSLRSLVMQYLVIDVLDSINKSRVWDTSKRFPITSLSISEQLLFALNVCVGTVFPIVVMYTLVSSISVALGSSPAKWPPMFDRPFHSTSLADFWTCRWHAIFRRVFLRLSLLVLTLLPIPNSYTRARIAARALVIFTLSAALHIMLMYRLELSSPSHPSLVQTFLDPSILAFFLSQPLGLAMEALVVRPLVRNISSDEKVQTTIMRIWAWGFMLWSGRFWSDVWVRRGMWGENEHMVGYSLVRGLFNGEWKA